MNREMQGCPVCSNRAVESTLTGLRAYHTWTQYLPGKVGLTDLDGVLERKGHVLVIEEKRMDTDFIPLGQRILLKTLVRMGAEVWVVWHGSNGTIRKSVMTKHGGLPKAQTVTLEELAQQLGDWYEQAGAE